MFSMSLTKFNDLRELAEATQDIHTHLSRREITDTTEQLFEDFQIMRDLANATDENFQIKDTLDDAFLVHECLFHIANQRGSTLIRDDATQEYWMHRLSTEDGGEIDNEIFNVIKPYLNTRAVIEDLNKQFGEPYTIEGNQYWLFG